MVNLYILTDKVIVLGQEKKNYRGIRIYQTKLILGFVYKYGNRTDRKIMDYHENKEKSNLVNPRTYLYSK